MEDRDSQFSSRMQSLTLCFLLPLIVTLHAEVVTNFKEEKKCKEYFYGGSEPQVLSSTNNYVHICQTYKNKPRFATLYDTANRIPVYSAYIYEENDDTGRDETWMIEPQLVNKTWEKNMMEEDDLKYNHPNSECFEENQAIDLDYQNLTNHNRGHLNPNLHNSGDSRTATFTLTNMVPQDIELNRGSWSKYEKNIMKIFTDCTTAYVLVGAIPSEKNWVIKENQKRVNIPDYLWHAYCCVDNNNRPYKSGAAAVRNVNTTVVKCPIKSLKKFLAKAKSKIHHLFSGNCDAQTNIGDEDCESIVPKEK